MTEQADLPLRETAWIILSRVERKHGFTVGALQTRLKTRAICTARDEAMSLIRKRLGWSYPQIGRFFNKDHSTVIYAVRRHEALMAEQSARGGLNTAARADDARCCGEAEMNRKGAA